MEIKIENITSLNKINNYDWSADKYAIGAFVQHTISNELMKKFKIFPDDNLLINNKMTKIFANECKNNYAGKYIFADDYIVINMIK